MLHRLLRGGDAVAVARKLASHEGKEHPGLRRELTALWRHMRKLEEQVMAELTELAAGINVVAMQAAATRYAPLAAAAPPGSRLAAAVERVGRRR